MNFEIIKFNNVTSIWPGKNNAMQCTCKGADGKEYQATIPKAEYDLTIHIMNNLDSKALRENTWEEHQYTIEKLKELIEAYGEEQYEKAETNQSIHDAGPDI